MSPILLAITPVIAAAITAGLMYAGQRRREAGRVATADAATIFEAAEEIRRELRQEVVDLRARLDEQERRADEAARHANDARERVNELRHTLAMSEAECSRRIDELERALARLTRDIGAA